MSTQDLIAEIWESLTAIEAEAKRGLNFKLFSQLDEEQYQLFVSWANGMYQITSEQISHLRKLQLQLPDDVFEQVYSILDMVELRARGIRSTLSGWTTNPELVMKYVREMPFDLVKELQQSLDQFQEKARVHTIVLPDRAESVVFGTPSTEDQFLCDVFMIMPFRDNFQVVYDDHIKPVVEGLNLKMLRGDDAFSRQSVMNKIWSQIHSAKLVIAECTGKNPNVFYELGIAHTLDKPVIMITQEIEDVPFDIRHLEVIPYEYTPRGTAKFEQDLKNAIEKLLASGT